MCVSVCVSVCVGVWELWCFVSVGMSAWYSRLAVETDKMTFCLCLHVSIRRFPQSSDRLVSSGDSSSLSSEAARFARCFRSVPVGVSIVIVLNWHET